jgi:hypothetical protein
MKICLIAIASTITVLLSISACGGGDGSTPAATTAPNAGASAIASDTTQASSPTSTQVGGVLTTSNNIATGDTMNGLPITNAIAISKLSTALASVPTATTQAEAVTYPIAGKQYFVNLVSMSGSDPTLNLMNSTTSAANTVTIIGEFQSFTSARIFPCTFNPADYKLSAGDCNTVNVAPGSYPTQSSGGAKCREIPYKSGIILQCIRD